MSLTSRDLRAIRRAEHVVFRPNGRRSLATLAASAVVAVTGSAGCYFYSTGRGKRSIWTEILDALALRGRGSMSRMHAVELVFAIGWAAFWIYWFVAAFSMKRGRVPWSRELRIRAVVVVLAILLLRFGAFRDGGLNSDPWRAGLGLFLFALGLGFAIWARLHIGRNWGTPMSQKDEPELVTSGPYGLVRHPIYSGILLAGVGTAVALSWLWLIAMALAGIYFVYSATIEERYLTRQFPDTYPAYRRSTKMLVPLIF